MGFVHRLASFILQFTRKKKKYATPQAKNLAGKIRRTSTVACVRWDQQARAMKGVFMERLG